MATAQNAKQKSKEYGNDGMQERKKPEELQLYL